jgi:hypothetical protein
VLPIVSACDGKYAVINPYQGGFAAFYPSIMAIGPGVDSIMGRSLYNRG